MSPRTEARPTPIAMMKGTVIGPVVTPPESKATARKSLETKKDTPINTIYRTINMVERLIWNRILRMATARKIPTPTATVRIRVRLGMPGTCSASTWRSGSDMVMMAPMEKPIRKIRGIRRALDIWTPIPSPRGVMDISAPSWKKPIPITSRIAPTKNITMIPRSTGTRRMLNSSTIPVMGSTAETDSNIFSFSFWFTQPPLFQSSLKIGFPRPPLSHGEFPAPYCRLTGPFCSLWL